VEVAEQVEVVAVAAVAVLVDFVQALQPQVGVVL
jgi:hypothetical protein